jgi:hypothetical protein
VSRIYARLGTGMCTRMKDTILVFKQRKAELQMEGRRKQGETELNCII